METFDEFASKRNILEMIDPHTSLWANRICGRLLARLRGAVGAEAAASTVFLRGRPRGISAPPSPSDGDSSRALR